jgi:hypothetical protein
MAMVVKKVAGLVGIGAEYGQLAVRPPSTDRRLC